MADQSHDEDSATSSSTTLPDMAVVDVTGADPKLSSSTADAPQPQQSESTQSNKSGQSGTSAQSEKADQSSRSGGSQANAKSTTRTPRRRTKSAPSKPSAEQEAAPDTVGTESTEAVAKQDAEAEKSDGTKQGTSAKQQLTSSSRSRQRSASAASGRGQDLADNESTESSGQTELTASAQGAESAASHRAATQTAAAESALTQPAVADDDLPRPPSGRRSKTRPAGPPSERVSAQSETTRGNDPQEAAARDTGEQAVEASQQASSAGGRPVESAEVESQVQQDKPKSTRRRSNSRKPANDGFSNGVEQADAQQAATQPTLSEVQPDETQAAEEDSLSAAISAVPKRTRNRSGRRQAAEQLLGEVPTDEHGELDKQAALQSLAAAIAGTPGGGEASAAEGETVAKKAAQVVVAGEQTVAGEADDAADQADQDADENESDDEDASAQGEAPSAALKRRRRRGGRRRKRSGGADSANEGHVNADEDEDATSDTTDEQPSTDEAVDDESAANEEQNGDAEAPADGVRRRRRRRRSGEGSDDPDVVVQVREPRPRAAVNDEVTGIEGSTRLEAKRQRRKEGRAAGRQRAPILTEAEFLARRESVDRKMIVRQSADYTQIAVLEDDILVEHYVDRDSSASAIGNVYLGKVQNVLPSMEAVFVNIGRGRNAVLYAGEVNWDAFEVADDHRKVEEVFKSGQSVIVQVSKDSVGAKGARLTGHISIPGRFVVYSPDGHLSGISRKLPDVERARLKKVLDEVVGDDSSVIVRTAAEGASEEELVKDVERLKAHWQVIERKAKQGGAPMQLYTEPDLTLRTIRDVFTEDFDELIVAGIAGPDDVFDNIDQYVQTVAPSLHDRLTRWDLEGQGDPFEKYRIDEQISKALERKVFLPSGGSLVIDRTEAMTVIDVNTGKFTGAGGNLEETVTRNNLEAAEEIVRQLRLRDLGGIVVIDFIDMVLPANRELLLRRLVECLGRDRTRHQVSEVTSLGLVQLTRKRIGTGLAEAFTEECESCGGRGFIRHEHPVSTQAPADGGERGARHGHDGNKKNSSGNAKSSGRQSGGNRSSRSKSNSKSDNNQSKAESAEQ